ncbi:MAG: hypothetical protein ACUZ8A_03745, partial [Candidatus Bathyanammoxibius sp.]
LLAILAAVGGYMGVPHVLGGGDKISNFFAPNFGAPEVHGTVEPVVDGGSAEAAEVVEGEMEVVEGEAAEGGVEVAGGEAAEEHGPAGSPEMLLMLVSAVMAFGGIGLAYFFYMTPAGKGVPTLLSEKFGAVYGVFINGWYFDAVYEVVFVDTYMRGSEFFWKAFDVAVLDKVVSGVAGIVLGIGGLLPGLQLGMIRWYATVMVLGAIIIILYS